MQITRTDAITWIGSQVELPIEILFRSCSMELPKFEPSMVSKVPPSIGPASGWT